MVTVQDFAFFIDEEAAVSVAVVGNAAVSPFFHYFFLQVSIWVEPQPLLMFTPLG